MTIASLGLAVDSAPAARAAVDLDKLAAASGTAEVAVTKLGTSSTAAMSKVGAGAGAISQKLREAANDAESMAGRINRALNVRTDFGGMGRGADIVAYGAELDRLRGKFNPLFATIQQYKAAQADIRQAHSLGAISVNEMTAALDRERTAALANIAALRGRRDVVAPRSSAPSSFNTANIAAQFQDIGVTAAMGMSPLQIALQQGTQLSAVFEQMRHTGQSVGSGLAAAFTSVVSPLSLLTVGAIAATAAALQYFMTTSEGLKTVDDILARHKANIDRLGPAYADALKAQEKYVSESPALVSDRLADDAKDAMKKRVADALAASKAISRAMASQESFGLNTGSFGVSSTIFDNAKQAIGEFNKSIQSGRPDVKAFQEEISRLVAAGDLAPSAGEKLRKYTDAARNTEVALSNMPDKVDPVIDAFEKAQRAIDGLNPLGAAGRLSDIETRLESLRKKMQAGEATTSDLSREINNLTTLNPDLSGPISEIARLLGIAALAKAQIEGLSNTGKGDRLRGPGRSQNEFDDALGFFLRSDKDLREKLESKNKEIDREAKPKIDGAASAYRDLLKSAQDRVAQSKLEADSAGQSGIAQDVLRFKLDLLQKSQRKGREISEAQTKALLDQVDAYEKNATAAAKATLMAELMFERQQMFRSPIDQTVASTLKGAGLPIDFNSEAAAAIRFNEQLKVAHELASDFSNTFMQSLKGGKNFFEALGEAALSTLDKISQKLMDMALDNLFSKAFGGGGASGGGLLGIISNLFGGDGSSASADPWAGMRMANGGAFNGGVQAFANGGVFSNSVVNSPTLFKFANGTGLMGEAGPEAIMPLKRDSSGRLGVSAGGAANSNSSHRTQVDVNVSVDDDGKLVVIARQAGSQAGAEQADARVRNFSQRELPDRMNQIKMNPRQR